jgi:hypothetical protein
MSEKNIRANGHKLEELTAAGEGSVILPPYRQILNVE